MLSLGLRIPSHPLGQVGRPVVHQDTPWLKEVGTCIGGFDLVSDHMRQGRLDHLAWMIRRPNNPFKVFNVLYVILIKQHLIPP